MHPKPPLSIDAFEVARKAMRVAGRVPLESLQRLAGSLASDAGDLSYCIEGFVDSEGHPGATLSLLAELDLICQRCNGRFTFKLDRAERFRFVNDEAELDLVPLDDDSTDAVIGSKAMDIREWIEDEAILSLPLVPRHPDCQAALAMPSDDSISGVGAKNPFAALASLKRPLN